MCQDQYISITLPSKCLLYEDIDVSGIKIRPFKGRDEVLIAELNLANLKKKFVAIIENVLQGIEPEKLTSGDMKYVMLWEAINSYTRDYPVQVVCENCSQTVRVVCDLGKIDSVDLPDDFVQPVEVKLSDRKVNLRIQTVADEIAAIDWTKSGKSAYLYSLALIIVDEETTFLEKLEMLENMSPSDINEIKKFQAKYDHGPDMELPYKCSVCEHEGKLVVPFRIDTLFSFRE